MVHRSIVVKHSDAENGWRPQWGDTLEPADERLFESLEEAGRVARALSGAPDPGPNLRLVKSPRH